MRFSSSAITLLAGLISLPCIAQSQASPAEQMAATEITTEHIGGNLYVLYGYGGNIVVSIGNQGVLIVDDQFPEMVPKYRDAIQELGGGDIDFGINTHWHYDHADGNLRLGPEGTWFVSQANSRDMMTRDNVIDTGVYDVISCHHVTGVRLRNEPRAFRTQAQIAISVIVVPMGVDSEVNVSPTELLYSISILRHHLGKLIVDYKYALVSDRHNDISAVPVQNI